jgi:hypothetical protein
MSVQIAGCGLCAIARPASAQTTWVSSAFSVVPLGVGIRCLNGLIRRDRRLIVRDDFFDRPQCCSPWQSQMIGDKCGHSQHSWRQSPHRSDNSGTRLGSTMTINGQSRRMATASQNWLTRHLIKTLATALLLEFAQASEPSRAAGSAGSTSPVMRTGFGEDEQGIPYLLRSLQ